VALVSVLLAGGVLTGMGALVVDVGLLYAEREQLQSGADAGATAVAAVCAQRPAECTESDMGTLAEAGYADANSPDGLADAEVCGQGLPLGACTPGVGNLTDCLALPSSVPAGAPYVEVRTTTEVAGGATALPPVFAGTFTGYDGTTIGACSRVSWGPAGVADVEPAMAISRCYWETATSNGTVYQPKPTATSYGSADPSREVVLHWHAPDDPSPACGGLPDGFGWFTNTGGTCRREVEAQNWYDGRAMAHTPPGCADDLMDAFSNRSPVSVAIIDQANDPAHPGEYRVAGIARFVVTGWASTVGWIGGPSSDQPSPLTGAATCSGSGDQFCVFGYFTTGVLPTGIGTLGDPHYGAVYLKTIG
jgi:Flp pilus assembly protein TadG